MTDQGNKNKDILFWKNILEIFYISSSPQFSLHLQVMHLQVF